MSRRGLLLTAVFALSLGFIVVRSLSPVKKPIVADPDVIIVAIIDTKKYTDSEIQTAIQTYGDINGYGVSSEQSFLAAAAGDPKRKAIVKWLQRRQNTIRLAEIHCKPRFSKEGMIPPSCC